MHGPMNVKLDELSKYPVPVKLLNCKGLHGPHNSGMFTSGLCISEGKVKAVPLQAWTGPKISRKLRFPDFVTTAQDGGRLSDLRTGRLYPQEMLLVLISVRG